MMKSKADDEDYWNNSMFSAFPFDEEEEGSRVSCCSLLDSSWSRKE